MGKDHIKIKMAEIIISDLAKKVGIRERISTHSLRKTFGYQARMKGIDLYLIQEKFRHSNMKITKRYLGITEDEINKAFE